MEAGLPEGLFWGVSPPPPHTHTHKIAPLKYYLGKFHFLFPQKVLSPSPMYPIPQKAKTSRKLCMVECSIVNWDSLLSTSEQMSYGQTDKTDYMDFFSTADQATLTCLLVWQSACFCEQSLRSPATNHSL